MPDVWRYATAFGNDVKHSIMSLVLNNEEALKMPVRKVCPKCKTGKLDARVPRAPMVKLFLGFLPLQRYHCYRCNRKSYIMNADK